VTFPVPEQWRKSFAESKAKMEQILHIQHPVMRQLLDLWGKFNHLRLVDIHDFKHHQKAAAFRMTAFRSMMLVQSERCRDKLMNRYFKRLYL
jgi:hypothetical protein